MRIVTIDELVSEKILPFDLFNEAGEKIFNAGEVLTPGKLLQLRYVSVMYRENFEGEEDEETSEEDSIEDVYEDELFQEEVIEEEQKSSIVIKPQEKIIIEKEPLTVQKPQIQEHLRDKRVNENSSIPNDVQLEIKAFCQKAMDDISSKDLESNSKLLLEAKEKIVKDVLPKIEQLEYKSQMKLIGEYDSVHSANVSILAALLATKLDMTEAEINDVTLAAMFHDVGKTRIPIDVLKKSNPSTAEVKLIKLHSQMGYKILKREMNMPEAICRVALEHHENNDGSGYPYGVSGDFISVYTQIVSVCNFYDSLTSDKGPVQVKNPKEAIKLMLEIGGKYFMPKVLYTFVHMSNFNDQTPIENLY